LLFEQVGAVEGGVGRRDPGPTGRCSPVSSGGFLRTAHIAWRSRLPARVMVRTRTLSSAFIAHATTWSAVQADHRLRRAGAHHGVDPFPGLTPPSIVTAPATLGGWFFFCPNQAIA
jgi:hypothetical protein